MSGAGQDWARQGAAAAKDESLASFAAGGVLLLWDRQAGRVGFANAAGHALLGGDAASFSLPAATRQRLTLLAGGLASRSGVRLERLRLTPGFAATLVTCGCKLIELGEGESASGESVLAIAVQSAELRRLGIVIPPAETLAATAEPEPAAPAPKAAPTTIRFLWQSDATSRLTSLSPNIAELVGPEAAAALPGRNWADLIGSDVIDRSGDLPARLAGSATWSGHEVLWRTATPGEGARVELSGVPVLDAARQPSGFRGFGLVRPTAREPFPLALAPQDEAVEAEITVEAPAPSPAAEHPHAPEATGEFVPETTVVAALDAAVVASAEDTAEIEPATEAVSTPIETALDREEADEPAADTAQAATETQSDQEFLTGSDSDDAVPAEPASAAGNIVPLRNGHLASVRPVLEPSKANLSKAERNAFREIAKALGARIAGEDEPVAQRLPQAMPLRLKEEDAALAAEASMAPVTGLPTEATEASEASGAPTVPTDIDAEAGATRPRLPNSHADVLDKLPIAVLVNRGEEALYVNRTLLDLLDYADLADLTAGGGVGRLIREATRSDGGRTLLVDRLGQLVSVDAVLSSVSWQGEAATLIAFRHPNGGGDVKVLTPEEAEEAELAAEFEAEERESAARVEALRLDADVRDARMSELVAMLDTATDGVVTVDDRGRILSLNKTAEALFGYDQREVTGELFTLLFSAESHAPALDYLEGLQGGGVASVMNDGREVVGRVRQGGKIPLFMTMGQIAEGTERRYCAVLRDITAWKKTEGELVEARKAAEKASAQKSDVLAKISHEIRTPLNAIIGFAEVMAEERFGPIENERYKEYLRDIHQSGGYVISLVNDLLDLAKIEAGKLDLDFVSVNLNEIALSAVSLLQPEAQRGRVVLRSGLSPKLPPVVADQRSIRQIVINLLSNAVKFTDAGGQVIISTALGDQGEAILRVRDTGIGMDDKEIELALEPFRQVPTTRRAGGTGLGLPLTKALVEANRAAMSITSVKKEGTLVEITFPPQRVLAG
ncbi:hypothetical protein ASE63_01880 [Bosea sp. Root381]|uniref:ATP-binding protein n=1 Tax=Bosea sp. Root381 TaxID=1736524 RepID=UPI0006FB888D|nr:ATP-binding protein [Bosea sp. Root381]KRE17964.1 hypothetical protein ASE63_01880 [Bosea sp. Root381]